MPTAAYYCLLPTTAYYCLLPTSAYYCLLELPTRAYTYACLLLELQAKQLVMRVRWRRGSKVEEEALGCSEAATARERGADAGKARERGA